MTSAGSSTWSITVSPWAARVPACGAYGWASPRARTYREWAEDHTSAFFQRG
ncbi:hypothetical protein ABZZ74_01915 [Streptomyces sp. NPDC006476]|uniref:hypothetical protein n=1 Tax=Streptomyces sp. NPDC006476 TaxID=3157175 RepID=UPI0033AEDF08